MKYSLTFNHHLPFEPEASQVIFLSADDNGKVSRIIGNSYELLKDVFDNLGLEFVHLPSLLKDEDIERKVRYYAPYLQSQVMATKQLSSSLLLNFLVSPSSAEGFRPSFIYNGRREDNEWVFDAMSLDDDYNDDGIYFLLPILEEIVDDMTPDSDYDADICHFDMDDDSCCKSSSYKKVERDAEDDVDHSFCLPHLNLEIMGFEAPTHDMLDIPKARYRIKETEPEEQADENVGEMLSDLQETVARLRLHGVSLMAIHELIDKQEPLSKLVITPDYRLFLPDYNNMEIEMGTLPKALYFLFLRYPKGIVLKTLPDHYTELLNIYRQLRPKASEERLKVTITKVTNPLGNAINENVARIRKAFVEKFDEHLAQNYFVKGERAGLYGISLDPSLVVWKE